MATHSNYKWEISPLISAAKRAEQAGFLHKDNIGWLEDSRATTINSFNNACLLYQLAAKAFRDIQDNPNSEMALRRENEVKINVEELKSEDKKVLDNPPIEYSIERIINPPTTTKLEHQVASWAATMAIQAFQ